MLIAQISDLHIGFEGQSNPCSNSARLADVLHALQSMKRQPDLILATGDLVETGAVWSYQALQKALKGLSIPIYFGLGNHDDRAPFQTVFPNISFDAGFLQYAIEDRPVRIIMVDSLKQGQHGGDFCGARATWLDKKLSEQPERPTLIALHHPPIVAGIDWIGARADDAWLEMFTPIIAKHKQIRHVISGHIHRPIVKQFAGTTLSVCPAIAPEVGLELADIDPNTPDGRALLRASKPGFSLHDWDGESFTTHFGTAPFGDNIVPFNDKFAKVVRTAMDLDI